MRHPDPVPDPVPGDLPPLTARLVSIVAIGLSLFQLYTAGLGAMTALVQRSVHLGAILTLTFLLYPPWRGARRHRPTFWWVLDAALVVTALLCCSYVVAFLDDIYRRQGDWLPMDVVVGSFGILLVLEACRRVIGVLMTAVCSLALLYAFLGPHMPDLLVHKGYGLERVATTLFLTTEGIFGVPLGVAATFVFVFVLFGAFLEASGGGSFFIDLAHSLTGRFAGGPAKTSVIASGLMGSVSGSAVANVVATGTFTIPMMKRIGYPPQVAGAIEAAASTGGQLMPPIMGAGAFLMAELTGTSYLKIIKIALVPAVLYYMTVLAFVHFEARKAGMKGQPAEALPRLGRVLRDGLHFVLPVAALVTALVLHTSPMMAGFVAVVSTWVASAVRSRTRMGLRSTLAALEKGARNAIVVSVACAAAGIVVGIVGLTGQGLNFSSLVVSFSLGVKFLAVLLIGVASLVLGMGLPVTASYIVLATLAAPALLDLGVPLLVAHMIVFWYSQSANVTPPVSLAAFAGAGIAGSRPMPTAMTACKLAAALYLVPMVMAYRPLLGNGPAWQVGLSWLACAAGLLSFAAGVDRFLFRPATRTETALLLTAALFLMWPPLTLAAVSVPGWASDAVGAALLAAAVALQRRSPPAG